jgi:predicted PurR-regulated permease PerM
VVSFVFIVHTVRAVFGDDVSFDWRPLISFCMGCTVGLGFVLARVSDTSTCVSFSLVSGIVAISSAALPLGAVLGVAPTACVLLIGEQR